MEHEKPLKIVLCWHMHQPDYRDYLRDEFLQPWVYLHGIKDYVDMAAHLEAVPGAKAVVNFSPILLEQLEEYERQLTGYLQNSKPIRDPLLSLLDSPVFPSDNEHRLAIVKTCLRANQKHLIERFTPYHKLAEIAKLIMHDAQASSYLSNQYLADLLTWYHLAWLGETVRRTDKRITGLIEQACGYTLHQRRLLLQIISELLANIRSQYSQLSKTGQIEISMSPYSHPMIPLLLKFEDARDAMEDTHLPILDTYPGGYERSMWHIQKGLETFERYFDTRPGGCWPSEGGISAATIDLLEKTGFQWIATGENVLRNSLNHLKMNDKENSIHHSFCKEGSGIRIFARDDTLSDLIGFTYADWHADDAVGDFIHRLETIASQCPDIDNTVVSIILDGENAWEYYPDNGYYFLSGLYQRLAEHPNLQLVTFQEALKTRALSLNKIVAGSWVFGTFSTWIGDEDKNRAWDILGDIKRVYDQSRGQVDPDIQSRLDKQLAVCEGSDWFWWFGDYNPAETVSDFERLYRTHIANLYHMLGHESPQYLSQTLSHGTGSPRLGGVIRPGTPDNSG